MPTHIYHGYIPPYFIRSLVFGENLFAHTLGCKNTDRSDKEIMSSELPDQGGQQQEQLAASAVENYPSQESLYTQLRTQLEFYFSPKNLSRDIYLRNMLTSEHDDMPTPRPLQHMCPVGIITNFPKVKLVCAQFGVGQEKQQVEPAALLLARALDGGSNVVTISPDGNWIGPINQFLPPPNIGGAAGVGGAMGNLPPRVPPPFQTHMYQHQQQGGYNMPNLMQGLIGMVPHPPPALPPIQQHHQRREGQGFMFQHQQPGIPYLMGTLQVGSESPSSTSLESLPQMQQEAKVSDLLPRKPSVGSMTSVSLLSTSVPVMKGGHPVPLIGQLGAGGAYPLPPGPSQSPPMMANQNANILPPYPIAPLMHQLSHPTSMMGGMQHMSQSYLFYHSQQIQQVGYPQQGVPQQPQMLPYLPHNQMGHQLPSQHGYPPHYLAYHGMQQQVDYGGGVGGGGSSGGGGAGGGSGGGGLQYHGYPLPPHQFHDYNRGAGSPSFRHSNEHHLNYDGGGQKNRVEKKKQKNHQQQHQQQQIQQQHQHQQQHSRYTYVSSSLGNEGTSNGEYNNHGHLQWRDHSSSSPTSGHHRGEGANKSSWMKGGEQQSQFKRNYGDATPAGFNSKDHNRHPQHHQIRQQQQSKVDENKDIFSLSDFPGLGGGNEQQQQRGDKKPNSNLVGYASALLQKKASNNGYPNNNASNNMTATALATPPTPVVDEVDSLNHRTEEMEREILSEFHDLSLLGNDIDNDSNNNQQGQELCRNSKSQDETTCSHAMLGTAFFSTMDTITNHSLPVLPAGQFGNDTTEGEPFQAADIFMSESSPAKSEPNIDVKIAVEFSKGESLNKDDSVDTGGPSGLKQQTAQPILASDDLGSTHQHPKVAWGSKRLFADVRLYYNAPFLTTHSILPHKLFAVICRSSRTGGEKEFTLLLASTLSYYVGP